MQSLRGTPAHTPPSFLDAAAMPGGLGGPAVLSKSPLGPLLSGWPVTHGKDRMSGVMEVRWGPGKNLGVRPPPGPKWPAAGGASNVPTPSRQIPGQERTC